ncbi:MAG: translation initiation factor IF-3 [Neisseriaceae bacterium]|nr:MAG: translation initiation factor IF-3 [Neisseriaceae bacterium]
MTFNPNYKGNKFQRNPDEERHRINWQIKVPTVRVAKGDVQLGIMDTDTARNLALNDGLDLVEMVPDSRPPVCRIMDYSRFKYEQKLKKKDVAKKQRESVVQLKEIRLRPAIAEHDTETKINQAKKFLEEGDKVQFNLTFRGQRELCHKDKGFELMQKIIKGLEDFGIVDKFPKMEGNRIICSLNPK